MNKIKLIKANIIIAKGEVDKIKKAITDAGTDIEGVLKSAAKMISGLTTSVSGIVLLFLILKTAWKSTHGNSGAWDEAANGLAVCVICLSLSAAVFTSFF